jgi:hypothetical protein
MVGISLQLAACHPHRLLVLVMHFHLEPMIEASACLDIVPC